jgi:type 1 glutamine amidotransferase
VAPATPAAPEAIVVHGGWDGHDPDQVAAIFAAVLEEEGFHIHRSQTLDTFLDAELLDRAEVLVPIWTMGALSGEQANAIVAAVGRGLGLAGCHGGMCDAFRESTAWQFLTGGNFVAHPGGIVEYAVNVAHPHSDLDPLTAGIDDFSVQSEQYYLHVDPAVRVLATTRLPVATGYHTANPPVDMPVVWCKRWGLGRVYYNALGHTAAIFAEHAPLELMRRGFRWAAGGRSAALRDGTTVAQYR